MRLLITLEAEKCLGHSQCAIAAPDLFYVNDDGIAEILIPELDDEAEFTRAIDAARRCPERAIHVEKVDA